MHPGKFQYHKQATHGHDGSQLEIQAQGCHSSWKRLVLVEHALATQPETYPYDLRNLADLNPQVVKE